MPHYIEKHITYKHNFHIKALTQQKKYTPETNLVPNSPFFLSLEFKSRTDCSLVVQGTMLLNHIPKGKRLKKVFSG